MRRVAQVLGADHLDALVVTLPENVLLVSGYWPIVGTAVAVATRDRITVLAPEDESEEADRGWAEVRTYRPTSLQALTTPIDSIRDPLATLLGDLPPEGGTVAFDSGDVYEPAPYVALYLYGAAMGETLAAIAPHATLRSALSALSALRATLTSSEVGRVRAACQVAASAFDAVRGILRPGLSEPQVAATLSGSLSTIGLQRAGGERAGGSAWCMSGPNSALAGAAYARTRDRDLRPGDLVLIHCNSYLGGLWTDITRTYVLGPADEDVCLMYDAIFAARDAALAAIHPGVPAAEVDAAAREVLTDRGFGPFFTHGLGHNVGFSAISGEFPPRLRPASPDRLEPGMTFNIEPAIYIPGYGGIRHCDVVTLTSQGPEVLTPFQADFSTLAVAG